MDTHYSLYTTADYSASKQIQTLHKLDGNTAYAWDETRNLLLAECKNADYSNIAFTSFETNTSSKWTFNSSGALADASSPTGKNTYQFSAGSVSTAGLQSSMKYIVSYWSNQGVCSVTGSTSSRQGKTIGAWTYYEHVVTGVTSLTVSGSQKIDELRLYPMGSLMTSYTYSPLIGVTTVCDPNNRVSYYEYDNNGRLKWIKDQDGNILKTMQYHFSGGGNFY
ncbi:MAG: hypothetical protein JST68_14640 [Bacteroidetes bacterium]|nr:hypothetical protein [Bacteroidota bacterium]